MILGFIGTGELLLIGGLALLLVGGKKLPELMRGLGKGVREFKDGMNQGAEPTAEKYNPQEQTVDRGPSPTMDDSVKSQSPKE